jgi:hypothetical protein
VHTSELIRKAELTGEPLAAISRSLGLNDNALAVSKASNHLSPPITAALAAHLGEPVGRWTMTALAETKRIPPALRRQLLALAKTLNS